MPVEITVVSAFEHLRRNVELTGLQKSAVAARQDRARAALDDELGVKSTFLTGSYVRGTLIGHFRAAATARSCTSPARTSLAFPSMQSTMVK
jgi:hypothetical protein